MHCAVTLAVVAFDQLPHSHMSNLVFPRVFELLYRYAIAQRFSTNSLKVSGSVAHLSNKC